MKAYPVAITIFIASVMIPGLKFVALAVLCAAAKGKINLPPKVPTRSTTSPNWWDDGPWLTSSWSPFLSA
jgi:hypothetical protein